MVREGEVLRVDGRLTLETVPALLEEATAKLAGARRIDLAGVTEVDSSAVALALEWQRQAAGATLAFDNVPESMRNLARLYGVSELLGIGAA
jgi:phospholipid transport system transporter-binding protein